MAETFRVSCSRCRAVHALEPDGPDEAQEYGRPRLSPAGELEFPTYAVDALRFTCASCGEMFLVRVRSSVRRRA